jgi:predicted dehydrogenase
MARRPCIGLVGCGRWGRNILRDLRGLGAEVHVADTDAAARRLALAEGARSAVGDSRALPAADGFVVATNARSHAAAVDALLESGRPIFVEKPFTVEADEAERLAAAGAGRVFVMDKWRYHPGVEALRDVAASGRLGRVEGLQSLRWAEDLPPHDVDAIWTLAPHEVSLALELLGHIPKPMGAVAERSVGSTRLQARLGGPPWQAFEVSTGRTGYRRMIEIVCEGGRARLEDPYAGRIVVESPGHDEAVEVAADSPLERELRAFLDHLAGGPAPRTAANEAAVVVRRVAELRRLAGLPD